MGIFFYDLITVIIFEGLPFFLVAPMEISDVQIASPHMIWDNPDSSRTIGIWWSAHPFSSSKWVTKQIPL